MIRASQTTPRPLPRSSSPLDPAVIGLGADHQHEIGGLDLPLAPERPALRRRGVVLIDLGVDAVSPEPIGKAQHALLVLDRVVAVADEDLGRRAGHRMTGLSSAVLPINVAGAPALAADHRPPP